MNQEELDTLLGQMKKTSNEAIDKIMRPEIMEHMTEAQKEFVTIGRDAYSLQGKTYGEKLENLTKALNNVANINK